MSRNGLLVSSGLLLKQAHLAFAHQGFILPRAPQQRRNSAIWGYCFPSSPLEYALMLQECRVSHSGQGEWVKCIDESLPLITDASPNDLD